MKIIDYRVVESIQVKGLLKEGWEPYCGPVYSERNLNCYQAMVKWSK